MALIVTPGAPDADSFASLEQADAYHSARGHGAWADAGDDNKEAALRRATAYLSSSFSWRGYRLNRRAQSLAWPRHDVIDSDGDAVPFDAIPAEIVAATCEIAAVELANPGAMSPAVDLARQVKSEAVDLIKVEYVAPNGVDAARPALPLVMDLIGGLLSPSGSSLVGTATRG
jgi:hypothetical protein